MTIETTGPAAFDQARYPRLASYLMNLPAGLGSYPECQVRGSVLAHQLRRRPLLGAPKGSLPARLEQLATEPPLSSSWIPEVELIASNLALADWYRMSDDDYLRYAYDSNKALFQSIIYRLAMSLLSPSTLLDAAPKRWASIHRGSQFTGHEVKPGEYQVDLTFPPHLFEELELRAFGKAFLAAMESLRARAPKIDLVEFDSKHAQYRAVWG